MPDQPDPGRTSGSETIAVPACHLWTALAWLLAVAILAAAGGWVVRQTPLLGVPVRVSVDGRAETVRSAQPDVAGLLAELGLALRPEDSLSPPPATPLTSGLTVTVQRARPGLISTDGRLLEVFTRAGTVAQLLEQAGIAVSEQDEVLLDGAPAELDAALPRVDRLAPERGFPRGRSWDAAAPAPCTSPSAGPSRSP